MSDLPAHAGEVLGHSPWRTITQDDVDTFARLTGDEQWIHIDPERAQAGPFGGTIVYGYLTLSLTTLFLDQVVTVDGAGLVLNYGSNRVRYPSPVPVGSQVRAEVYPALGRPHRRRPADHLPPAVRGRGPGQARLRGRHRLPLLRRVPRRE